MGPTTIKKKGGIQNNCPTCGLKNCINKFVFMCNYVIFTWNYKYYFFRLSFVYFHEKIYKLPCCTIFKWKIIKKYHGQFFYLNSNQSYIILIESLMCIMWHQHENKCKIDTSHLFNQYGIFSWPWKHVVHVKFCIQLKYFIIT
jgi:hypothetical protein